MHLFLQISIVLVQYTSLFVQSQEAKDFSAALRASKTHVKAEDFAAIPLELSQVASVLVL